MITTTTAPGHPAADDRPTPDTTAPGATDTADTAAISLRGVHKRYGAVRALDGVDLTVRPGEILALLGPNGAGKSTAMEMMVGLARPDQGTAQILGTDPATATRTGLISTMLQGGALLPDQSVRSM